MPHGTSTTALRCTVLYCKSAMSNMTLALQLSLPNYLNTIRSLSTAITWRLWMGSILSRLCGGCATQRCRALRGNVPIPHCVPHVMASEESGVVPVWILEATHVLLTRQGGRAITSPQVCLTQVQHITYTLLFMSVTWLRMAPSSNTLELMLFPQSCILHVLYTCPPSASILEYLALPHVFPSHHIVLITCT